MWIEPGLRIRIRIPIGSGSVFGIRIQIQEGKNDPQKVEKNVEISYFEVLNVSFELQASFVT
jgi:hypothetical protein